MRIIAGEHRGRKIKQPKIDITRPTKDRVREAVFNIIAMDVPGANFLDLFSGSGAFGLEALSRGAKKAVFVENNFECSKIIRENINSMNLEENTTVMVEDVYKSIEYLAEERQRFDLIFADPPYNTNIVKKLLIIIYQYDIVSSTGFLILEHHKNEDIPGFPGDVSLYKQRTYGKTIISVFKKNE
ncbi:MAG: 16S rRNA (guanine(966)-N(2))-methyltransferase RsmD [Candidatus Omnitrophica bacterium]|nr:16S rRNA (guanine(966)-N(2))-methyltransferase RsmD [Candidatus Omnitrophota bacterium]